MAREFRLPDLGSGLKEGRILRWCVAVGDQVTTEATLCELETEKAVIDVPVPFDGVVLELAVEEQGTVNVGEVLAVMGETGESATPSTPEPKTTPDCGRARRSRAVPTPQPAPAQPTPPPAGQRVRAMPSIRRMARQHGIDLSTVTGTGSKGRVTRGDLEAARRRRCRSQRLRHRPPPSQPGDRAARRCPCSARPSANG